MKRLSRTHAVIYLNGIKVMHNFEHDDTTVILPSSITRDEFIAWLEEHKAELREFKRLQSRTV